MNLPALHPNRARALLSRRWLAVFAFCWFTYALHWAPFPVREHFPAITLAEHASFNVAAYNGWIDDIFVGPRGGAYINNNPGASLAGSLPIAAARPLLDHLKGWNRAHRQWRAPRGLSSTPHSHALASGLELWLLAISFITAAGLMAPVSAFAASLLGATLEQSGLAWRDSALIALLYAFGTPIFFRTSYLNHNVLVAQSGLIAALLIWDRQRRSLSAPRAAAAGLLAGFSVLCDFTGLLTAAALCAYVWLRAESTSLRKRLRLASVYCLATLPALAALFTYQRLCFGDAVLPSQHYMPPTAPTVHGYRGFDWPSLSLAWANLFEPRWGLLIYCPLLAASFLAPFLKTRLLPLRESLLMLAYAAAAFLFCASNHYSWLQHTTGFRYLVIILPWLLLLALDVLKRLPRRALHFLAALSIAQCWLVAMLYEYPLISLKLAISQGLRLSWALRIHQLSLGELPVFTPYLTTLITLLLALSLFARHHRRAFAIAAICICAFAASMFEWANGLRLERIHPPRGRMIALEAGATHLQCVGTGSPAIVLDSGIGAATFEWARLQPRLAALTTTCSWDRPGYGWSDPIAGARDSTSVANLLHQTLTRAGIAPPYIVAGHSLGGLHARAFAFQFPHQTAALVLVESISKHTPPPSSRETLTLAAARALSPFGLMRPLREIFTVRNLPPEIQSAADAFRARPSAYAAASAELAALPHSLAAADRACLPQDLPIIVVSARGASDTQRGLVSLSSRTRLIEAATDHHYIQIHDPATLESELAQLVSQLRKEPR